MIFGKMFNILYSSSKILKKDLQKLVKDKKYFSLVKQSLEKFAMDPHNFPGDLKKLHPKEINRHRIRIGIYRIILSVDFGNKNILVHRIWLRKDIYQW